MEQETNETKEKIQPEKKFRVGGIAATVWKREGVKDGKGYSFYTVSLDRSYKDKEGKWQNTGSMRVNDLPKAALVINEAFRFVSLSNPEQAEA